jgi:hypothetical protein
MFHKILMKEIVLQIWEQSEIGGFEPDGCSLHSNIEEHKKYLDSIYSIRDDKDIPDFYDSVVGEPVIVLVNDNIFSIIENKKSVRLQQHEMNNLIGLKEIKIC